jgi:hypothetical protein
MATVQGHPVQICIPGINVASPLGSALVHSIRTAAEVVVVGRPASTTPLWRWMIRGTALDWFGPVEGPATAPVRSNILLDLHGIEDAEAGRIWRVVDATGRPLLKPFAGAPFNASLMGSLYLIETVPSGAAWVTLGEAHVSARRRESGFSE